ncbi:crinkler (CRN) family protein [Thraustotheca clavata]|uniref:Crinkler (CRN) family protein n=1 Tax=Thraustotheca clavata TaxID=74557 RepID=A0A1V9ZBI2_9STRA|nr:crinkler (CRN) family protein [Thraustotheca clavata]
MLLNYQIMQIYLVRTNWAEKWRIIKPCYHWESRYWQVCENGALGVCYLFSDDRLISGDCKSFSTILQQSSTYYIADAIKLDLTIAKSILLTLPDHQTWHQFNKIACTFRYMPCQELLYPQPPVELVENCFDRWGRVARYYLIKVFEQSDTEKSQHLLQFKVDKSFRLKHFVFASRYHLVQFLASSNDVGLLAILHGFLFKQHVHTVLPLGGTFRMRRLLENNDG